MFRGYLLVIISAMGFGLIPIFALYAYNSQVSLTTLLFLRFAIATLFFFGYILLKKQKLALNKYQLLSLFILGGVLYTLQSTFYFSSVKFIPASLAALLLYLYPVFVTILSSYINKEKISKKLIVSITISLIGMVMVLGSPKGEINLAGVLLAIGSGIIYSIYIIFGNRVALNVHPVISSAFISLFASLSFLIGGLFTNSLSLNFEAMGWLPIIGTALFSGVIAIFTFFVGMTIIGPTKASILSMIEPVVTILFSTLLLNEKMSFLQFIGGIIVLTGAVLVILVREKTKSHSFDNVSLQVELNKDKC